MTITYSREVNRAVDPASSAATLFDMAKDLLAITETNFAAMGLDLPGRRVVYMSPIPADCEQVAVVFTGWTPDQIWSGTTVCASFRWLAGFSVIVTRCTPALPSKKGLAPTAEQMMDAAQLASQDAEALLTVVTSVGEIGTELSITTAPPSGGFQSVELDLSIPAFQGVARD